MKVLVRDEAGLEVCLDFDYGDTVGDVRNTLNAAVSAGCGVAEVALVPQALRRHVRGPEVVKRAADAYVMGDVFFDLIAAQLDERAAAGAPPLAPAPPGPAGVLARRPSSDPYGTDLPRARGLSSRPSGRGCEAEAPAPSLPLSLSATG